MAFGVDVLRRAVALTLGSYGQTAESLTIALVTGVACWVILRYRAGGWKAVRTLPPKWKQRVKAASVSTAVGAVVLLLVFGKNVYMAASARDTETQGKLAESQQQVLELQSKLKARESQPTEPTIPFIAENPDHANLVERLDAATQTIKTLTDDLVREQVASQIANAARQAAEQRSTNLADELARVRKDAERVQPLVRVSKAVVVEEPQKAGTAVITFKLTLNNPSDVRTNVKVSTATLWNGIELKPPYTPQTYGLAPKSFIEVSPNEALPQTVEHVVCDSEREGRSEAGSR